MKRLLCLAVIMVMTLSGCYLFPSEEEALAPPLVEPKQVEYVTEPVTKGNIELNVTVGASFVTTTFEDVYYQSNGHVKKVNIRIGDWVKKGDLLIEMENEQLQNSIRDQTLRVRRAELTLARAGNSTKSEAKIEEENRLKYETYMQDAREQELNIFKAEINLRQALAGDDNFAKQQAQLDLMKANDKLADIENAYNQDTLVEEKDPYEVQIAKIDLEMERNSLKDLQTEYDRNVVYSPMDGQISWIKDMKPGDAVQPYTELVRVVDPTVLQLQYQGDKAKDFPLGTPVSIKYKNNIYKGAVLSNPSSMPLTEDGKMQDIAIFSLEDFNYDSISMGESATVSAVLDSRQDVIVVEKSRVNNYWGRQYVNVLEDGVKVERDVEVGLSTPTQMEIKKGLNVGDLIIIR